MRRAHSANQRTTRGKTQATRATHKPREINARPVNVIETFAIKHENHTVHTFAARVQQRWQRCKVAAAAAASATAAAAAAAAVSGGGGGVCARAANIANESQSRHSASTCNQEHIAEEYAGNYCMIKQQRTQVLRERQWRTHPDAPNTVTAWPETDERPPVPCIALLSRRNDEDIVRTINEKNSRLTRHKVCTPRWARDETVWCTRWPAHRTTLP